VKIDDDVPMKVAALIGCGVLTGVGAAMNTANIKPGDTVAVVGCGGVGLNVIQGARIAGASRIIAVDMNETKLQMARDFGATDVINASDGDPVGKVMGLTEERGPTSSFEVIGLQQTIDQVITMTRRGGEVVLVGVPKMDAHGPDPRPSSAWCSRARRSRAAGTGRPTPTRTSRSSCGSTSRAS
jgi:S-(hydroxymethyl)glutathione dehydrogenase/alcohol dehydrogenase